MSHRQTRSTRGPRHPERPRSTSSNHSTVQRSPIQRMSSPIQFNNLSSLPSPRRRSYLSSVGFSEQHYRDQGLSEPMVASLLQSDVARVHSHSDGTIENYEGKINAYINWCKDQYTTQHPPSSDGPDELRDPEQPGSITLQTPLYLRTFLHYLYDAKRTAYSTVEGYRAALKLWYKRHHRCRDGWHPNDPNGDLGNPIEDWAINEFLHSCKKNSNRTREVNQSLPMLYPEMTQLHNFFNADVEDDSFSTTLRVQLDALFSLCFTCMFRIDECLSLRMADILENQTSEGETVSHTLVTVTFRKSNQDDRNRRHQFKLYSNQNEKAKDARQKRKVYISMLRGSKPTLSDDDYLFPFIRGSRPDFSQRLNHSSVANYLKKLTEKLNLLGTRTVGSFTTHCFRRGGAQFRFMYSSPRWSLEAIKWWRGWAKGESVGQIYKYLLEEYSKIEYDYQICSLPIDKIEI